MSEPRPLWSCPECGHQFVTANTWHSCGNYNLEDHFAGKVPIVRQLFERLLEIVSNFGDITMYPQKTRIVFQARTRFASAVTRQRWLITQIWLKREADHPLLQRIERYTFRDFGLIIRLSQPEDIDEKLESLLLEAYDHASR